MAKRSTGIEKNKTTRSKKTAKRIAKKHETLKALAEKRAAKKAKYTEFYKLKQC